MVLAVGGKNTIILMSDLEEFHCFERIDAHSDQINALVFVKSDLLFSASYDKCIKLWQISRPNDKKSTQLLKSIDTKQYLLSLSYSHKLNTLLASGEKGVFFWFRPLSDCPESSLMKTKYLVDGLKVIGDNEDLAAIRIHMTRYITIIDLNRVTQEVVTRTESKTDIKSEIKSILLSKVMKAKLESFDTEYPFIYLSAHKNLLASGGPAGQIWLYDWNRVSQLLTTNQISKVDRIFEWPQIENILKDNKLVIDDKKPIIVNMVAISSDLSFLVACTSMNLICIWQKTSDNNTIDPNQ